MSHIVEGAKFWEESTWKKLHTVIYRSTLHKIKSPCKNKEHVIHLEYTICKIKSDKISLTKLPQSWRKFVLMNLNDQVSLHYGNIEIWASSSVALLFWSIRIGSFIQHFAHCLDNSLYRCVRSVTTQRTHAHSHTHTHTHTHTNTHKPGRTRVLPVLPPVLPAQTHTRTRKDRGYICSAAQDGTHTHTHTLTHTHTRAHSAKPSIHSI